MSDVLAGSAAVVVVVVVVAWGLSLWALSRLLAWGYGAELGRVTDRAERAEARGRDLEAQLARTAGAARAPLEAAERAASAEGLAAGGGDAGAAAADRLLLGGGAGA